MIGQQLRWKNSAGVLSYLYHPLTRLKGKKQWMIGNDYAVIVSLPLGYSENEV